MNRKTLSRKTPINNLDKSEIGFNPVITDDLKNSIRTKFPKNYFGLPISCIQQSPDALVYLGRKPMVDEILDLLSESSVPQVIEAEKSDLSSRKSYNGKDNKSDNYVAQRKVANALLTMVRNSLMERHFLHKGGFEAVVKLVSESKCPLLI